jgi:hypothetical protein
MRTNSIHYWDDKREKLLKKYNNLTYKDLKFNLGKEEEMIRRLCKKLGKTTHELLRIIVLL